MPKRLSTARGREFGEGMRKAIANAGLSAREVAELLDWDEAKVSNVLTGKGGVSKLEVALLLGVCRVEAAERDRLLALFPVRQIQGWWQQHGACAPIRPSTAHAHVSKAKTLICWQPHVVPIFLRTDAYMRELLVASATVPAAEHEERLRAQSELRALLGNRLVCTFFIHEFALQLQVGGPKAHADQIHHLMFMANWKNIEIRIVPAEAGAHAGVAGPFSRLKSTKYEPVVWVEAENSSLFIEKKESITGYEAVGRELDRVSLDRQKSIEFIDRLHTRLRELAGQSEPGCDEETEQ
ncbi:helix-turn-helix transcriptional regulator [Lentzea sp. BCCO 10_0061]|uniref:Helix-turn-helix transcriptional regulator n=1 Tax=Lentzea sokolovensis TaxID=3095429 RepID=A0ABU4UUS3_9PSEU|nr:helix-turn-helix transcriptional regulator [Lentzea sp. BCCO 10_0061]MDX8143260.1 helix-turn-helix transcriptional regulator [Lentzea sp. BCCO 10_0061]